MANILAVGVYMADRPNTAAALASELAASREHTVVQRWIALAPGGVGHFGLPATVMIISEPTPKFALLDRVIGDARDFDWLLLCDDDIEVGQGFVDRLIGYSQRYDFALSQPARTTDSYIDHPIVQVLPGLVARQTRFVEIGPLVCLRRDAMELVIPFGPACGMGWGLDFVWPARLECAGLRLGIIDATPIAHRIRPSTASYDQSTAQRAMDSVLEREPHLSEDEAFSVLETYT